MDGPNGPPLGQGGFVPNTIYQKMEPIKWLGGGATCIASYIVRGSIGTCHLVVLA